MESTNPTSNPQDFLSSAAVLLLKSSVSITERCREDLNTLFPSDSDPAPMIQELLAFLGSIVLHEAHAKNPDGGAIEINQTCHHLKDALVPATNLDPSYLNHAQRFDDQTFHELMTKYLNGKIDGFDFSQEELQHTSDLIGIPVPNNRGIETIFFALITRIIPFTTLDAINELSDQKKAATQLTQLTETGISSFALALQLL